MSVRGLAGRFDRIYGIPEEKENVSTMNSTLNGEAESADTQ